MPASEFTEWHASDYLETEEDIAAYLAACAECDDPRLMEMARHDVEEARKKFSKRQ